MEFLLKELLFRLASEPRRLWRRYAQYPLFVVLVLLQARGITRYDYRLRDYGPPLIDRFCSLFHPDGHVWPVGFLDDDPQKRATDPKVLDPKCFPNLFNISRNRRIGGRRLSNV